MKDTLLDILDGLKYLLMAIGILSIVVYSSKRETTDECRITCEYQGYKKSVMVDDECWCMIKYKVK